ncbi:hypothetical protein [Cellvibrio sp.]|uniref:hypothetical protein n=1 Tax=Cellvibrio sp. TaxID=1965322 RepID=UPI0039648AC5
MKYYKAKLCSSKSLAFLIMLFFGVSAHARQQCQDIKVYTTGGCGSVNMCSSGKEETQKVCYEVPDEGAGPIPGGAGAGTGSGPSSGGGGGDRPEPPKRPKPAYCNTIDLDNAKCKEDAQTKYRNASSSCSNWTYGTGAVGLGLAVVGAYFTGGATLITYLEAGATGGFAGLGGGSALAGSCDADKLKTRDSDIAACDTKTQATKLDCATY